MLGDVVDELAVDEFALGLAYTSGEYAERERIATATAELDAVWRARGAGLYRDRVAERIEAMERCAAANPANTWRGRWPGGPTVRRSDGCLVLATPVPWDPEADR